MIKRVLGGLLPLLLLLAAVLLANPLRQGSRQVTVPPLALLSVDEAGIVHTIATAVHAKTVSGLLDPAGTAAEFDTLHALLKARYPLAHEQLTREVVGGHSLLFSRKGSDAAAQPAALMAHQNVVPIAPGTERLWQKPPFDGVVDGGFVWGRGRLDDKSSVITQLEASEMLLKAGVRPRRTIYFVLGHDEEVGGALGAVRTVELLKQRGVKLAWVLDEGLAVTEGVMQGAKQPVALIGLTDKGSVSLKLTATTAPGHFSMPPGPGVNAIGMRSDALARLDAQPLPGGIQGAAPEMFAAVAPERPFGQRLALSNLWPTRPLIERTLSRSASTHAMMRTNIAMTDFNAGIEENVLLGQAEATVNFRSLPGDTIESVQAFVKVALADDRIEVEPLGTGFNPSRLSSSQSDAFKLVERTLREVFADSIVAPGVMSAAYDARHVDGISEASFRFMPERFNADDLKRPHGTDERIATRQLVDMARFYHRLLTQAGV